MKENSLIQIKFIFIFKGILSLIDIQGTLISKLGLLAPLLVFQKESDSNVTQLFRSHIDSVENN